MKKSGKISRLGLSVLLGAACVVGGTLVADAGLLHSIEHTANKAANTVVKDTNTAVNAVTNTATSSTKILQSEVSTLANQAKATYASVINDVQSGYTASVNAMKAAYTAALEAVFRATGNAFLSDAKSQLTNLQSALVNLDNDGKAAYTRIRRAIPVGQFTTAVAQDMKTVAAKIGMVNGKNIPKNVTNSSWGIPLGGGGGKLIFGVEGDVAFVMNVQPNSDGKYACGIMTTVGGSLGASAETPQAEVSTGIMWQPGTISDNQGWSVGFGISAGVNSGLGIGLSWGVSKGMSGASNAIPGMELDVWAGTGEEVDASFKAGYSKLIWQGTC